jgi:nucleoside-diphosphate-sugar epimerase
VVLSSAIKVLLIGGRGRIGSGLRQYLPRLDAGYRFVSIDLPGAANHGPAAGEDGEFVDLDFTADPEAFRGLLPGIDLVVYLARQGGLAEMNRMTDLVYESALAQDPSPMIIGSSSVHAVDAAYLFFEKDPYPLIAQRRFAEIREWPAPIPATLPACPVNDYGSEKAYVEAWTHRAALRGAGAVAARWGGINAQNRMTREKGYFAVWCHQEDAARFVHACFTAHRQGGLRSGAHYFAVSNNTYNIFDLATPAREIGYQPLHDAEVFYR